MPAPLIVFPLRLPLDRRAVRETLVVRAVAAVITMVGSAWLLATQDHWSLAIAGLLTGVFAVVWLARGLRVHRSALEAGEHVLLDHNGLTHCERERSTYVGWEDVVRLVVDEDRLMVALRTRDQREIMIEPSFAGLGVYDLKDLIARAWRQSQNAR